MSQHGEHLPEDLRDIAARLSAARVRPNPLELDELRQRVDRRAARAAASPRRRRLAGALRMNFVASALTSALVLTSGAGVVLACTGGGQQPPPGSSSNCEYNQWWTKTGTWPPGLTVTETWKNSVLTLAVTYVPPPHTAYGFKYQFAGKGLVTVTSESITLTAPTVPGSLTVYAGGQTYVFSYT